jgi:hypothetical protein
MAAKDLSSRAKQSGWAVLRLGAAVNARRVGRFANLNPSNRASATREGVPQKKAVAGLPALPATNSGGGAWPAAAR